MDSGHLDLTAWSGGLAAVCYLVFALRLLQAGYIKQPREASKIALLAAVSLSALWGAALMLVLKPSAAFLLMTTLADQLRYAAWFAFLLILLGTDRSAKGLGSTRSLVIWAVLLVTSGPLSLGLAMGM